MSAVGAILIAAACAAIVNWWAVFTDRRSVERVAKPLTMVVLVALASMAGDASTIVRILVVIGAAFGVIGDAALLGTGRRWFLTGLVAFAVGHMAYTAAAIALGVGVTGVFGAAIAILLLSYRFIPLVIPAARVSGGTSMVTAVLIYATIIAAMVTTAVGTGVWVAACGALLFALSDWVLGQRQFLGPEMFPRLAVMVPYHIGQTLLIVGLLS
jgi:uncharacterized membrane protein YhhN